MKRQRILASLLGAVSLVAALLVKVHAAQAHPGHRGSERVLKLDLSSQPEIFSYALILSADQASLMRAEADGDRDGSLNEREIEAAGGRVTEAFLRGLKVCRGSSLAAARCAALTTSQLLNQTSEGWTAAAGAPLALAWDVRLDRAEDEVALRIEENFAREHVARTSVQIEPHPQRPLLRATAGQASQVATVELESSWEESEGGTSPRILAVEWQAASPAWSYPTAAAAAALLALLGGWAFLRTRAARDVEKKALGGNAGDPKLG